MSFSPFYTERMSLPVVERSRSMQTHSVEVYILYQMYLQISPIYCSIMQPFSSFLFLFLENLSIFFIFLF